MEAAVKLVGEEAARAEALSDDLAGQRAEAEAQHHVMLGLQQVKFPKKTDPQTLDEIDHTVVAHLN